MISLSTCPGPTDGSWSSSPHEHEAGARPQGTEQMQHQGRIDHRGLVHDDGISREGPAFVVTEKRRRPAAAPHFQEPVIVSQAAS